MNDMENITPAAGTGLEIAVIGMAVRFPGARNIQEYLENLKNGVESVRFFSDEELQQAGVAPEEYKTPGYVGAKGFLQDADRFDAGFFGYTPAEASVMEPQVRIFHECAWEALEDAGYDPGTYPGMIGLYAGAANNPFWQLLTLLPGGARGLDSFSAYQLVNKDNLTTLVSYNLDLKGPGYFLNTACSTSLVAVHVANQALLSGECHIALAGGVTISFPRYGGYLYQEGMVASPDGRCRAFDAAARGTVGGEGVGVVALKLLEDAVTDGDHIHAVIKGSAVNNDGKQKTGYTAPGIRGQAAVIKAAHKMAETEPETIGYIEAHGTGTLLGDPIEMEALKQAFDTDKRRFCGIGSVKTNFGHLDIAAGVAGFVKAVLSLKERSLFPSLHFKTPNPRIDFVNSPFFVATELSPWPNEFRPLRAGVSSFGIGGTNAHVVLEEWTGTPRPAAPGHRLLVLSAASPSALDKMTENLVNHLESNPTVNLADAAYTLQVGRKAMEYRRTAVASSVEEAIAALSSSAAGNRVSRVVEKNRVIFLFPGVGSQYVDMGRELYQKEPVFRDEMNRCFTIYRSITGVDMKGILYPDEDPAASTKVLDRSDIAQPVIFMFEYVLARLLTGWGIHPHAMIGYSLGEYAAAAVSGVFSFEDALRLIVIRGNLVGKLPGGAMTSVPLSREELLPLLESENHADLSIAVDNGSACIVSGPVAAVEVFELRMKARRLLCMRLRGTSHAIHSHAMDPILGEFEKALREVGLNRPRIPYISNVTGTWITEEDAVDPHYWSTHLSHTVRFGDGIGELVKTPGSLFIEVGPGTDLAVLVKRYLDENAGQRVVNLVRNPLKEISDVSFLLSRIGYLWSWGVRVNWRAFQNGEQRSRVSLPVYSFDHRVYYPDSERYTAGQQMVTGKFSGDLPVPVCAPEVEAAAAAPAAQRERPFQLETPFVQPETPMQETVAGIWAQFFGIRSVGIRDDFFELGGDSLKAMNISNIIRQQLNVEVPVAEFFQARTVENLARYIEENSGQAASIGIEPAPLRDYYPLSAAQERLYILQQMEGDSTAYNEPLVVRLEGDVQGEKLQDVFKQLIRRHESLRTSFELLDGEPVQRIHAFETIEFSMEYYPEAIHHSSFIIHRFIRPFDLSSAPLMRTALYRLETAGYILAVDMHHIISDGTSQAVLIKDFMAFYQGRELPPLKVQYKDFTIWQNRLMDSPGFREQEAYWLEQFNGGIPQLELPGDYPRPAVFSFEGQKLEFEFSGEETAALKDLAAKENVTLFMLLLSLYNVFLFKLSGQEDIVVGSPIAGRRHADLQPLIGVFINTLAFRNRPAREKVFSDFLREVGHGVLRGFENQDYPFDSLVEKVVKNRDTGRNPLFDVMLVLQNMESPEIKIPGLTLTGYPFEPGISRFDMALTGIEGNGRLYFTVEYSTRLFSPATMQRYVRYFRELANNMVRDPGLDLWEYDIIPDDEKQRLLFWFNDTAASYPEDKTIHQLFEVQAGRTPDAVAVVEPAYLSYSQLNQKVNQLAHLLRKQGVGRESIVPLLLEPSGHMMVAILAVLKAGGAYLPIDPNTPKNRMSVMLDDAAAGVLLTTSTAVEDFPFASFQDCSWEGEGITLSPPRPQVKDFDSLPQIDRSLVNYEKYNRFIGQAMVSHAVAIQAGRGCPYNCAYCHKLWPKTHVFRSAENILAEVRLYYDMGVRRFVFIDDIFNLKRDVYRSFFQMVIAERLDVHFFFPNGLRGDLLTPGDIDLMVEAGTVNIALALETASPRLQKLIGKNLNLEVFKANVEYISSRYPHVILELFTMHGFPTETEEEARLTLDFIKSIKWLHFPYVHVLKIYPNTGMEKIALANGISRKAILDSMDLAFHQLPDTLPFASGKSFTTSYQAEFLEEYFLSRERLLHVLPFQMAVMTEEELVQKYDSYLSYDIRTFDDLLQAAGITREEMAGAAFVAPERFAVPQLHEKMRRAFPKPEPRPDALKILLIDLSQFFTQKSAMLYDVVEPPLGLMALMTHLNRTFGGEVSGKVVKSRIDFNSFDRLKELLEAFKPHVIGIRTLSYYRHFFHQTVQLIRQWGITVPIITGGPYAVSSYETVLQDRHVDLVVMGEGEKTLEELVRRMLDNNRLLPPERELAAIPGIAYNSRKRYGRELILLDELNQALSLESGENPEPVNQPDDIAYIIFTSGSTGLPKGVMVEHRNVVRLMINDKSRFDFNESDVWTLFHSYSFDFSVWEMYGALLFGGALVVVPKTVARDPRRFLELLKEHRVTVLNQTPSAFYALIPEVLADGEGCPSLRYVIFGGEALNPGKLAQWLLRYPRTKLVNMYGITETTVHVTYKEIGEEEIQSNRSNIGTPIPTLTAYIMDNDMRLKPIGVPGEICVGGVGVGRGYLNRPELMVKKFAGNSYKPVERLYRSGDLAKMLPTGEMEYLGRIDSQVKIRGFRIELGEIEKKMLLFPGVKEAVVIDITAEDDTNDRSLYAYIVSAGVENGQTPDFSELREFLSRTLPEYMIPSRFIPVEKIPLTPNGKTDRKALLDQTGRFQGTGDAETPLTPTQAKLVHIWQQSLEIDNVGIHDNFFNVGGDSIKAIKLVHAVNKEIAADLKISDLYMNETIAKLSAMLAEERAHPEAGENADMAAVRGEMEALRLRVLPSLSAEGVEDVFPMSDIEKGMIFHSLKDEGAVYHDQFPYQLWYPGFDFALFKQALVGMMDKHENLRSAFNVYDFEEPLQLVYKDTAPDIELLDMSLMEAQEQKQALLTYMESDRGRPFDTQKAPLWRMRLFDLGNDLICVLWIVHHAVIDGWSNASLMTELNNTYLELKKNPGFRPGKLACSYKDYVAEQLLEKRKPETIAFWQEELTGYKRLNFPGPLDREDVDAAGDMVKITRRQGSELLEKLQKAAAAHNTHVKHLFFAAYVYMLSMLSYENDVVTGLVAHNRPVRPDGEKMVGCFLNTVPVRVKIPQQEEIFTWSDYIRLVDGKLVELTRFNRLSFYEIVRRFGDSGHRENPFFDTLFNFTDFHVYGSAAAGAGEGSGEGRRARLDIAEYENTNTLFDFGVNLDGSVFSFTLSHSPTLMDHGLADKLAGYFLAVLEKFVSEPDSPARKDALFSREEKETLLQRLNGTASAFAEDKTLHQLFEEQAARNPDRIALVGSTHMTYSQLNDDSSRLARVLQEKGVKPGVIVGIEVERSVEMIIGMLAILKAGGVYIPIDPGYPEERKQYMLKDSSAQLLLTTGDIAEARQSAARSPQPVSSQASDSLAYIIYTSGSTGRPKGILIEHRNVAAYVHSTRQLLQLTSSDVRTQQSSFSFDQFVEEVYPILFSGGKLVLLQVHEVQDTAILRSILEREAVTVFSTTPPVLNELNKFPLPSALRAVITGGDVLKKEHLTNILPRVPVYNFYGPTETTVCATHYDCREGVEGKIPIGKPKDNYGVKIVDNNGMLLPLGVPGEICIGGAGVGRGYLNRPELTAEQFNQDFQDYQDKNKTKVMWGPGAARHGRVLWFPAPRGQKSPWYRSGDLGRWLPDGNIEFLGRIDRQVKVRGFRIELGEIEARLLRHEAIKEAVVLSRNGSLCAYIVTEPGFSAQQELRDYLALNLPAYMVPAYFVPLESIPVTANGKVDVKALPEPEAQTADVYAAPESDIETLLAGAWQEVLEVDQAGLHDDFFRLGGDSIKAIQVSAALQKHGYKLEIKDLLSHPVLGDLAPFVKRTLRRIPQGPVEGPVLLTPVQVSFLESRKQGREYEDGDYQLNQSVLLFCEEGFDVKVVEAVFSRLVEHHDALRMAFRVTHDSGSRVVQENQGPAGRFFGLEVFDMKHLAKGEAEAKIEALADRLQVSVHPLKGPLVRLGLFQTDRGDHLLAAVHHLVVDTVSWRILLEDLAAAFEKTAAGEEIVFPPKTDSFKYWSESLYRYAQSPELLKERDYWEKVEKTDAPLLPVDFVLPEEGDKKTARYAAVLDMELSAEDTENLLKNVNHAFHTEINDILLTALSRAFHQWTGLERMAVSLEGHGRESLPEDVDVSRTVGWFTTQYPVVLASGGDWDIGDSIKQVKETLRQVPRKGIGYGILKYLTPLEFKEGLSFRLRPEISFNYLGQFTETGGIAGTAGGPFTLSSLSGGNTSSTGVPMPYKIDINGLTAGGKLSVTFTYNANEYEERTVRRLTELYKSQLSDIIAFCTHREESEKTLSDFTVRDVDQQEMDTLFDVLEDTFGE